MDLRSFLVAVLLSTGMSMAKAVEIVDTSKVNYLDEVTVEANCSREVKSTAPLHLLDLKDAGRLGVTDIADALHRMPGVMLRDYGGAGGMKTISVRGFGAQHTGVAYDGVLLSECQSGEIDVSRYSLNNVDKLSLVVGDNDDIFISARQASTPAVLSIESMSNLPADRKAHLDASIMAGSFGYVSPFLKYTQRWNNRFTLSASGEYTYAENNYPFILKNVTIITKEQRTNSRMNSGHGEINMNWQLNETNRLWTKVYYYDNDRQLPGQVRYYTSVSGETLRDRNAFAQTHWQSWNAKGNLMMKLSGKFNWAASIYKDALYPGGVKDASYWQREYYGSLCVLYMPSEHWSLDYSADYAYNNLNSSLETDTRPYRQSILQSATAKYHNNRLTVLGRLLYSLYLNDAQEGASAKNMRRLTPSLSASWRMLEDEELYLRLSYKDIFRSPTFNESYFYHYGSTDLNPELTNQLNLGASWMKEWGRLTTTFMADAFINKVKDKIVAVPYNMFVWTNINVGKVESKGLELTLKGNYRMNDKQQFTLSGNWSYQRVENRTNKESEYYGNQIAYQPLHTGSCALGWENPWINLSLHSTGMSSRWTNNNHYPGTSVDGYMELSATAWKTLKWHRQEATLRLDVMNLLNTQYEIVAHYPMPRRNWKISINYKF